jgi:mannose-6-phosphate isomerase-like protein (cupin superfamily)
MQAASGFILGLAMTTHHPLATVPALRNRASAPHYTWGDRCDGWRLHDGPDASVIEERVPPGAGETPHSHTNATQVFYLLEGSAVMELPDQHIALHVGDALTVPPGTIHRFANPGAAPVRFLVLSFPRQHWDRVESVLPKEVP